MTAPIDSLLPNINSSLVKSGVTKHESEARRVAEEFEALLLTQLTKSLNPSPDDEEDGDMFRSSASDTYRQMFSEQLAGAMAKSGGVGIADLLLSKMEANKINSVDSKSSLNKASEVIRMVREEMEVKSEPVKNITPSSNVEIYPHLDPSKLTRPRRVNEPNEPVTLRMPVEGRISSDYGMRRDPINGRHKHHHGIDIAAPKGTRIGAAASGKVLFAGWQNGYGNTVVIEHKDGRQTRYAHAHKLMVEPGDIVEGGQTIATVGSSGRSTGPHLHFEVTDNGRSIDPLKILSNDLTLARR
jgi:murein DD-endopeptidase MepM/ murein hydrolase activator NlpD